MHFLVLPYGLRNRAVLQVLLLAYRLLSRRLGRQGRRSPQQWQAFRTRKDHKPPLTVSCTYAEPGEYCIVAPVVDILGNAVTKTMKVQISHRGTHLN